MLENGKNKMVKDELDEFIDELFEFEPEEKINKELDYPQKPYYSDEEKT